MRKAIAGLTSGLLVFAFAIAADGQGRLGRDAASPAWAQGNAFGQNRHFNRIATFANYRNQPDAGDETVSEIVAATANGQTLVYTDAETGSIGLVDIKNPRKPKPLGIVSLGGEPTSVDVLGNEYALVAVNTSEGFIDVSGKLFVVDIASQTVTQTIDLGGQPDSLKISPDERYAAIAIENERNEDIEVGGVEGGLPQAPAGYLSVVDLATWWVTKVEFSANQMAAARCYGAEDPEPEFVDINDANQAVVTMQENNCLALVNLGQGIVTKIFDAGTVDLDDVDGTEDSVILLGETLTSVPREPDAVTWIKTLTGPWLFATANEGDLFGGSRGFSIFDTSGAVVFDSGNLLEHTAVRLGHYPEDRSENKGSEPEAVAFGSYQSGDYLFVGSERGSFVAVFKMEQGSPVYLQTLPAPLGPEGLLTIPDRNLLVVSGEEDDPRLGVRSTMMIYQLEPADADYPQLMSANDFAGKPIPWSAMSGMTAVPGPSTDLLAVWDSYYSESRIFTIDPTSSPAMVKGVMTIVGGSGNYDPEGIAVAPNGTYWVASEGNASGSRPNRLLHVDQGGNLLEEVFLPEKITSCRDETFAAAEAAGLSTTLGSGFEGVEVLPVPVGYRLLVAQQRGWNYFTELPNVSADCEALDDDAAGLNARGEPLATRLWVYNPQSGEWEDSIPWELAALPPNASWVGLSEITLADSSVIVIERDNRTGDWTDLKTLVEVSLADLWDADGVTSREKSVFDLLPAMRETNGWISDKPEGVAIDDLSGDLYLVTDNDGVEDWSGETLFLHLGSYSKLFE